MLSNSVNQTFLQRTQQDQTVQQLKTELTVLLEGKVLESVIRKAILNQIQNKNTKINIHGELIIVVDSKAPVTVKINPHSPPASKRKSYTPVRILPTIPHSPDSMSIDSGTFDLSRSAPFHSTEFSPVVPSKINFTNRLNSQYENYEFSRKMTSTSRRSSTSSRRNFPCNQCNEVEFHSLQQLEEHTMQVHGSYRCHVCSRTFTQRSNLQRHALKHVGFKPFRCGICLQGYYRKDHLMRHMEVNHPTVNSRENIKVFLSSSQSLDYLNISKFTVHNFPSLSSISFEKSTTK
nr:zinc finger protein [Hymenolepis microstoma]